MIENMSKCTGCNSCLNICPRDAITVTENLYGFTFPVIDLTNCVKCGLCEKVCHLSHDVFSCDFEQKAYAAINNDVEIQDLSSSAGVFSMLASYIIDQGGVVFGAAWKDKYSVRHIKIESQEQLKLLRRSKYIQSEIGLTYRDVKKELERERKVLFSGTPCQVAGLKCYLMKEYANLYLLDVVCHGVPNSHIYKMFIDFEEKKRHRKIESLDFRYKIRDKASYITAIKYKKFGKQFTQYEPWFGTSYGYFFMNGEILRESCFSCKYADRKRVGDITLGDFWGVKEVIPNINERNGVGLILINSEKGEVLFDGIAEQLTLFGCDRNESVNRNPQMIKPSTMPSDREIVLNHIKENNYELVNKHYCNSITQNLFFKRIRYKMAILIFTTKKKLQMRRTN